MSKSAANMKPVAWSGRRRFATGLNVIASVVLATVVVIMANVLSARYFHFQADVSSERFFELSEKTRQMLSGLEADISIYVVIRPRTIEQQAVLRDIANLLKEYGYCAKKSRSLKLNIEIVDPDRDLARAEALQQKYGLASADVVVFDADGRTKCVTVHNIVEYEYQQSPSVIHAKKVRSSFRGEQAFSSAILAVTQAKRPVAYFVRGHGEHDIGDFEEHVGYSDIARSMRLDNIDVRSISLTERNGVPADCDVLVVAGPTKLFHRSEIATIRAYLDAKRNLMLLLHAGKPTGLEPLMAEEWGLFLPREKVVEKTLMLRIGEDTVVTLPGTGDELYVRRYGLHEITAGLNNVTMAMYLPRSVVPVAAPGTTARNRADVPIVSILASSSDNGWAETDFDEEPPRFDEGVDRRGPVGVAAAIEKGRVPGVNIGLAFSRIVVVGDSDFVANGRMSGGNEDFFLSSVNWLLERETLMAIGPKSYEHILLQMDDRQVRWLFLMLAIAMPGMVVVLGLVVWFRRGR